jgi:non-heme chloroperoxidase
MARGCDSAVMKYITTKDHTSLYVKVWGSGRPVILLHGWPLCADSWDAQAMALAKAGFQTIAYDRRGFGRSSQPWTGYDYDTLTDDLAAVIEQTGVKDVALVGFSMGGGEVARYLSRYGAKAVRKVAVVSSVVPYLLKTETNPAGTDQSVFDKMSEQMQQDRAAFFATFFKQFYGVGVIAHPVSQEVLEWSRAVAMQASLKATLDCAQAFSSTDFRPDLPAFTVPTLIVHGTSDKTVPIEAAGRAAHKAIAQSQLMEYDGAPHGLSETHKHQLSQDLVQFLA